MGSNSYNMKLDQNNIVLLIILVFSILNIAFGLSNQISFVKTDIFKIICLALVLMSMAYDWKVTLMLLILFITVFAQLPKKYVRFNLNNERISYDKNDPVSDEEATNEEETGANEEDYETESTMNDASGEGFAHVEGFASNDEAADRVGVPRSPDMPSGMNGIDHTMKDNNSNMDVVVEQPVAKQNMENEHLDESIRGMTYVPFERLDNMQNNLIQHKVDTSNTMQDMAENYYEEINAEYFEADSKLLAKH
jgi:hypothetical protein